MAGIAFRLQKLLAGESYTDLVRAYSYSAVIASGPFIIVVAMMALLRLSVASQLGLERGDVFMASLVYAYGFSMLGVSPFFYVVTRYIADKYFLRQPAAFTPAYLAVLEFTFLLQAIAALVFLRATNLDRASQVSLFGLYLVLSGTWIAMLFLSAARGYGWIVAAFVAGAASSVGLSLGFGSQWGFSGFLFGCFAGQAVSFILLTLRVFSEFGYTMTHDYSYLGYFRKYPDLAWIGVFYYFGIWADKLFFWFAPTGIDVAPGFRLFPAYDTPMFLAYLSVVPSAAFFLLEMETSFAGKFHAYYRSVRSRCSLGEIRRRREVMMDDLTRQFRKFVVFQGAFTGLCIVFIYHFADAFRLDPQQMGILRIGLLGAFLQMGFMMVINVMFYFDLQREVKSVTFLFLFLNAAGTWATWRIGLPAYGFGYTIANFLALFAAFLLLDDRLRNLDFLTFMQQPVLIPKFKLEGEGKDV